MSGKRCLRPLICPLCRELLQEKENSAVCPNRHTYDFSREGYLNLLLSPKKVPQSVGDSLPMLQARRAFLDSGAYAPLAEKISEICGRLLADHSQPTVVDAGCGEGYYLEQLANRENRPDACYFGVDVAKAAARLAAKRKGYGRYLVANINHFIPIADQSTQVLLNIFAPRNIAEFARILHPDGHLIIVIPHEDHLAHLRQTFQLLNIQPEKREQLISQLQSHFALTEETSLRFELQLNNEALQHLVQMTPNARHLTSDTWQQIKKQAVFHTEACFDILHFSLSR